MTGRHLSPRVRGLASWVVVAVVACGCSEQPQESARPAPPKREFKFEVDERARAVAVPALVAEQGEYKELGGAIEYAVVAKGGKEYETVFTATCSAQQVYEALLRIGMRPGQTGDTDLDPRGMPLLLFVEYEVDGELRRGPLDEFIVRIEPPKTAPAATSAPGEAETLRPLAARPWLFTGSSEILNPETDRTVLLASLTESLVGLYRSDPSSLVHNARPEARGNNRYRANMALLPKAGTPVRVVFQRAGPKAAEGVRRVHVLVGGRFQGLGYRVFTERRARQLGLVGFVRHVAEGRAEAVIEGRTDAVGKLLDRMKLGPLAARVKSFEVKDEPPEGEFETFEVWY